MAPSALCRRLSYKRQGKKCMKVEQRPLETVVTPAGGGKETLWLLVVIAVTVICCAAAVSLRTREDREKRIQDWQIDAFQDLSSREMAIYNGLQTASEEIIFIHSLENRWPEIRELQDQFITPFVEDAAWGNQGRITWQKKILDAGDMHIALYYGSAEQADKDGSFLLLMLHDHKQKQGNVGGGPTHAPYEIWFHASGGKKPPEIVTDQSLISSGWKEIVALTGEDEMKRMKGTSIQ